MSDAWCKFYPSDWLSGTRGMTLAEQGLYITLIAMMYERGAPVDMPHGRLARLCGTSSATFNRTLRALIDDEKIIETEHGLWSRRVAKELKNRSQKRDQASQSARARWEKEQQKQSARNADASKTQCESDATRNQKPDTPYSPPRGKGAYSDRFEAWWKAYPRKLNGSKSKASARFERLSEADKQLAEQALGPFKRSVAKTEERYIPHATTWLNERRFETVKADLGPEASDDLWRQRLGMWAARGTWSQSWGPDPDSPACKAPADLIRQAQERAA